MQPGATLLFAKGESPKWNHNAPYQTISSHLITTNRLASINHPQSYQILPHTPNLFLVNSIAAPEHLPTRPAEIATPGSHLGPETAPSHPTQLNQHPWLPSQISGGRFWDFATASDSAEDENGQGSMGVIRKKTASRGTEAGTKFHCDVCSVDVTSTVCSPQHIKR